jgi:hypothetical protein
MFSGRLKNWFRKFYYTSIYSFVKSEQQGPVFIVGTGRSGTHFLCSCLNLFNQISDNFDGRESPYMFWDICENTVHGRKLKRRHKGYYKWLQRAVAPKISLDQTHPNLWNVEELITTFPNAKFIAIKRDVYAVIYSMKIHGGVSKWAKYHEKYPKPNRFLGITDINQIIYVNELTDMQRDVFRWCSHMDRIEQIHNKFPDSVRVIDYEDLASDMKGVMISLADFLGLEPPTHFQEFTTESLVKSRKLSESEIQQINSALTLYRQLQAKGEE